MFADDTELHFSHSNLSTVEQTLQTDIWNVSTWVVVNKLKLNVLKSLFMLIGSHQSTSGECLNLVLYGATLKQVCTAKYLGVYFDQHLTWDTQVNYVRGNWKPISPKVLKLLYQAFILPVFYYCGVVWCPSSIQVDSGYLSGGYTSTLTFSWIPKVNIICDLQ